MPRKVRIKNNKPLKDTISFFSKYKLYIIISILVCVIIVGLSLGLYFGLGGSSGSSSGGGDKPPNPLPPLPPLPTVSPYVPGKPVSIDEWGGWATTTVDSESATPRFPDSTTEPNIDLSKIASNGNGSKIGSIYIKASGETIDVIGTMGVAIPWAVYASIFGFKTRLDFLNGIIDSCAGKNNQSYCVIVQPINKFPDEIKPPTQTATNSSFSMITDLCNTTISNCTDINDPNITATYNGGTKYPAYLLVPFMGCGGDCNHNDPGPADCFNGCSDVQNLVKNFNYFTECQGITPNDSCKQIKWMSDNDWIMNSTIEQKFIDNGDIMFAISNQTENGQNMNADQSQLNNNKGRLNYCSGKNMHFDVERYDPNFDNQNPFWTDIAPSGGDLNNSISLPSATGKDRGGQLNNTIVRYCLVPGNIFGNFNVLADGTPEPKYPAPAPACPSSGGGSGRCGVGWDDPNICKNNTCSDNTNCPPGQTCFANIPCGETTNLYNFTTIQK